jgi:GcrA cell cycle regulator
MEWTEQRIEILRRLWGQGQTASQIATILGGVTRNAVIGKAHRLGLTGRPSPIKRDAGGLPGQPRRRPTPQRRMQPSLPPMAPSLGTSRQTLAESGPTGPNQAGLNQGGMNQTGINQASLNGAGSGSTVANPAPKAPNAARNLQAGTKTCSWPVGDPKQPGFHFCGEAAEPGRSYCAHHCNIAYHRKSEAA